MTFLSDDIDRYARAHTTPETDLLAQLSQHTRAEIPLSCMLSGHLQGRLLALLSGMIRPKHILEVGTYTGYSALCLAEGLLPEGRLHTIDARAHHLDTARAYFAQAGLSDRIQIHHGEASHIIATLKTTFDLVFLDADKKKYPHYYELILPRLRSGGFLIADNVLWKGRVLTASRAPDTSTRSSTRSHAIHTFNRRVQEDPSVENVLLPIRDGLMIVRKR